MKRHLFLFMLALFTLGTLNAVNITIGNIVYTLKSGVVTATPVSTVRKTITNVTILKEITYDSKTYKVTRLGAFQNCTAMLAMTIPETITEMPLSGGYSPLDLTSKLRRIHFCSVTPISYEKEGTRKKVLEPFITNGTLIYVPAGSVEAYKTAWPEVADQIFAAEEAISFSEDFSYRTYYSNFPLTLPDNGLKAFYVSQIDEANGLLKLTNLTGVIPAGTGVILKGTKGNTYHLEIPYDAPALEGTNFLSGTEADTIFDESSYGQDGKYISILVKKDGQPYFGPMTQKGSSSNYTLGAHKAFIPATSISSNKFTLNGLTGIKGIQAERESVSYSYDLNGRAVKPAAKGIVIKNRKKYFVK